MSEREGERRVGGLVVGWAHIDRQKSGTERAERGKGNSHNTFFKTTKVYTNAHIRFISVCVYFSFLFFSSESVPSVSAPIAAASVVGSAGDQSWQSASGAAASADGASTTTPGGETQTSEQQLAMQAGVEQLMLNDGSGMNIPAGQMGNFQGHPNGVDPYMYLNNISAMQGGMPPQLSAHAAYMSLPNNIVPNVNFLGGGSGGPVGPQSGPFGQAGINIGPNGYMHAGRNGAGAMQQQGGPMQLTGAGVNPSICKFYLQGHCARGEQCNYAHITPAKGMMMMPHGGHRQPRHGGVNGVNGVNGVKGDRYSHGGQGGGRGRQGPNGQMRGKQYQGQRMMYAAGGYANQRGGQHRMHAHHQQHMYADPMMPMPGMSAGGENAPIGAMIGIGTEQMTKGAPAFDPNAAGTGSLLNTLGGMNGQPAPGQDQLAAAAQLAASAGGMTPLGMHGFGPMGPMGLGGHGMIPMDGSTMVPPPGHPHPHHHPHHHHQQHQHHPHHSHHGQHHHQHGGHHATHHHQHGHHDTRDPYEMAQQGYAQSPISDFLSKFTATSSPEELTGHIYLIAKDQYGCRLLQRMLDEQKPHIADLTFNEVFDHMNELMTDPFGNYLCQKLIEHCNEQQRFAIIQKVAPDLVAISLNMHGTRAVQKLVETINTPKEVELVIGALRASVVTLIKDLNGNHVIQRCLHHLNSKDNQFIYDAVSRHCVSVATHKHGCCVLQRTIDYATISQKRQLVQEIISNALELVQDAFGNYVVQYILDLGDPTIAHGIMTNLLGNISSLSVQKFSSNVVEKCLELSNDKMRMKMIEELINPERLPRLLQDPYANYVLQKALGVSKKQQFERLVQVIKPHLIALRNTSFGKRIQSKILKKFPDLNISFDVLSDPTSEMTPIVLGAMVSGLSGVAAKRTGSATGVATPATAGARGEDDSIDVVNGAPGGITIAGTSGTATSLSPDLSDPLHFIPIGGIPTNDESNTPNGETEETTETATSTTEGSAEAQ